MKIWLAALFLLVNTSFTNNELVDNSKTIIKGISLVSPEQYISNDYFSPIKEVNADWVALTPFGFLNPKETQIQYPTPNNYWGDYPDNLEKMIQDAHAQNLKILLKPHVWIEGQGWAGDYDLYFWEWKHWEKSYEFYILSFVKMAEQHQVEMFCIGVEWKKAIERRPKFWKQLIQKIRSIYSGKLIYAANWDEYESVPFWKDLDFVGIDGYFPLSDKRTPSRSELMQSWNPIVSKLSDFYKKNNRPIIFTEYGYRSTDFACWNQWEIEHLKDDELVNLKSQQIGYEAFYESVWNQDWFAGGFIWKWIPELNSGGLNNSNYTPQRKPVMKTIKKWYGDL